MRVSRIAREAGAGFDRLRASGQNGDAVPALLAVPDRALAAIPDRGLGKFFLWRFQFLEARDIRQGFRKSAQQDWQTAIDSVHVERGDLHCGKDPPARPVRDVKRP